MVSGDELRKLTDEGIVKVNNGIRVIDASRLNTVVLRNPPPEEVRRKIIDKVEKVEEKSEEEGEPISPKNLLTSDMRKRSRNQ